MRSSTYMIKSDICVKDLARLYLEDNDLTVVSKGRLYTPSFQGYTVVNHNRVLSNSGYDQLLCVKGLYVNQIKLMSELKREGKNLTPVHVLQPFDYICSRLTAGKEIPLLDEICSEGIDLLKMFYMQYSGFKRPADIGQALPFYEELKSMDCEYSLDYRVFVQAIGNLSDSTMSLENPYLRELYFSVLCTDEHSPAENYLYTLSYLHYFKDAVNSYGREVRHNIIHNSLSVLNMLKRGTGFYEMEMVAKV